MSSRFSNVVGSAAVIAVAVVVILVLAGVGADLEAAGSALRERESALRLYAGLSARLEALERNFEAPRPPDGESAPEAVGAAAADGGQDYERYMSSIAEDIDTIAYEIAYIRRALENR